MIRKRNRTILLKKTLFIIGEFMKRILVIQFNGNQRFIGHIMLYMLYYTYLCMYYHSVIILLIIGYVVLLDMTIMLLDMPTRLW